MTPRIPEKVLTCLVDWSIVVITDNTWPPRDPNHDDNEDEEDEEDEDRDEEPPGRQRTRRIAPHIAASVKLELACVFARLGWFGPY
jgi:hypothetical protein